MDDFRPSGGPRPVHRIAALKSDDISILAEVTARPRVLSGAAPVGLAALDDAFRESVWIVDHATRKVTFANARLRALVDRPLDTLCPTGLLLEHVQATDVPRLEAARSGLPEAGYAEEFVALVPSGPGARRVPARWKEWGVPIEGTHASLHVLRDLSLDAQASAKLHEEMTRRSDVELDLHRANERVRLLIETANDAVITIDIDDLILDWNQAAEAMFGWSRREAVGARMSDLIIPERLRATHRASLARARIMPMDGRNVRVETTGLRRTGEEFDTEVSVWCMESAGGRTFGSFVRDISARKSAQRAISESEERYRTVVENVNEGIVVTANGWIRYANPKSLDFIGITAEQATSGPFVQFIHPDDRQRVVDNHVRRMRGEEVENRYQFRVVGPGGRSRWLEISAVRFAWNDAPATLNFLTDITDRKKAEEDLMALVARERELAEMKSKLVSVASHEFRTPLAAILSSVDLLHDHSESIDRDERAEIVEVVRSAVFRMNRMIDQVLLANRLETAGLEFHPEPVCLRSLTQDILAEMELAGLAVERIGLEMDTGRHKRHVDPKLYSHVLGNLLSNALKYSEPLSQVKVRLRGEGSLVVGEIEDSGIGIAEGDLPRLFRSFHRGENVGSVPGTGMGLYIVGECLQRHGGAITVRSSVGTGTTFSFSLLAPED